MGPSDESSTATANTGEAAHINSASTGPTARRHDPQLTADQRKDVSNGIWCCNLHAKLIDTDEVTYTAELLKTWRSLAETKARLRQTFGDKDFSTHPDVAVIGLAPEILQVELGAENQQIGQAVERACIREVWGTPIAGAIRDFLIEHTRNAVTHGSADQVEIRFETHCVKIIDNGRAAANTAVLNDPTQSRGGGMAYRALLKACKLSGISLERDTTANRVSIPLVLSAEQLPSVDPCSILLPNLATAFRRNPTLEIFTSCDRVYVIAPNYSSYSDIHRYQQQLEQIAQHYPNLTLILQEATEEVIRHFTQNMPEIEIVKW